MFDRELKIMTESNINMINESFIDNEIISLKSENKKKNDNEESNDNEDSESVSTMQMIIDDASASQKQTAQSDINDACSEKHI